MQSFQKRSEQNLPSTTCTIETLSSAATKAKKIKKICEKNKRRKNAAFFKQIIEIQGQKQRAPATQET